MNLSHVPAPAPAAALRFADLLEPVEPDAPCGPDLEYDPAFVMLSAAVAPKADAQYGAFIDAPPPVNWAEAERDCRALLLRTKDIRLAVILARCRIRQSGAAGLRDGLEWLKDLLERFGDALHPVPYDNGVRDPVMFANAIAAIAAQDGLLAEVRDIALPKSAGLQLQVRDIGKSFAIPRRKDALTPEAASRMLNELWKRRDRTISALADAQRLAATIAAWCADSLGNDAPDLAPLVQLLQPFSPDRLGATPASPGSAATAGSAAPSATPSYVDDANGCSAPGQAEFMPTPSHTEFAPAPTHEPTAPRIDRWTALESIRHTRVWFEEHEPSSPVAVLLRQAERMVGKRFSEIADAIPADLLARWDRDDD